MVRELGDTGEGDTVERIRRSLLLVEVEEGKELGYDKCLVQDMTSYID